MDNLTVGGTVDTLKSPSWSGDFLRWHKATSAVAPVELHGGYIALPENDTLRWSGSTTLTGPLYLLSGYLDAPGLSVGRGGTVRFGSDHLLYPPTLNLTLIDTGHHFIGNPAFFSQLDTLPYCSVWDAAAGRWTSPQGETHLGRVLYLFPDDVPLTLTAPALQDTVLSWRLQWCDSVQGGTSPLSGWNLLSNPLGHPLWWDDLCQSSFWPDSVDATYYGWNAAVQQYASYSANSGAANRGPWIGAHESFWVRLSHTTDPGTLHVHPKAAGGKYKSTAGKGFAKSGGQGGSLAQKFSQVDTTHFIFTSSSSPSQVAQSTLYVNQNFDVSFMPCCDQLFMAGRPEFGVKIIKNGQVFCSVAHLPMSVNYPLEVSGEGALVTAGVPGYFYHPPHLQSSTQPLKLKGKGPHTVYWLSVNHPDGEAVSPADNAASLWQDELAPVAPFQEQALWDLLGRPAVEESTFRLYWDGTKWVKEVRVNR